MVLLVHRDALFDLATHHLALLRAVFAWLAGKIGDPDAVADTAAAASFGAVEEETEGVGEPTTPRSAGEAADVVPELQNMQGLSDDPTGSLNRWRSTELRQPHQQHRRTRSENLFGISGMGDGAGNSFCTSFSSNNLQDAAEEEGPAGRAKSNSLGRKSE